MKLNDQETFMPQYYLQIAEATNQLDFLGTECLANKYYCTRLLKAKLKPKFLLGCAIIRALIYLTNITPRIVAPS